MTFIPEITDDDDVVPLIELRNEQELLARVRIGRDDETGAIYSVFVALTVPAIEPSAREVSFDVIEALPDGEENWCTDGLQTRRFLVGEHRKIALACICSVLQTLLKAIDVDRLFMMTITPDLPAKALQKYDIVCGAVNDVGFQGGRDSPFHGTHVWLMERLSSES